MSTLEVPGRWTRWRHYKGGEYMVILISKDEETEETLVSYQDGSGVYWTRRLSVWHELVDGKPRFSPV